MSEPTSTHFLFDSPSVFTSSARKWLYLGIGWAGFGLGVVGAVLPIMPALPFFIVSAWGFSRSSPELESWLMQHPLVGPSLVRFRRYRVVPTTFKALSIGMMVVGFAGGFVIPGVPLWARLVQAGLIVASSIILLQFPSHEPPARDLTPRASASESSESS